MTSDQLRQLLTLHHELMQAEATLFSTSFVPLPEWMQLLDYFAAMEDPITFDKLINGYTLHGENYQMEQRVCKNKSGSYIEQEILSAHDGISFAPNTLAVSLLSTMTGYSPRLSELSINNGLASVIRVWSASKKLEHEMDSLRSELSEENIAIITNGSRIVLFPHDQVTQASFEKTFNGLVQYTNLILKMLVDTHNLNAAYLPEA